MTFALDANISTSLTEPSLILVTFAVTLNGESEIPTVELVGVRETEQDGVTGFGQSEQFEIQEPVSKRLLQVGPSQYVQFTCPGGGGGVQASQFESPHVPMGTFSLVQVFPLQ